MRIISNNPIFQLIVLLGTTLLLFSCSESPLNKSTNEGINEGIIEYKLTYPNLDSSDIGLNLLPQKMTLKFKGDYYRVESEGGMGLFVTGYVTNTKTKKMDYFLKIISSKIASRFKPEGIKHLHRDFPSFRLEKLDSTRTICGYKCKGKRVIYYSNIVNDHFIWYTNEIGITDPNWCAPFKDISGVMMSYQVQQSGLVVNFEAEKVYSDSIPDKEFHVPLEYKIVSNQQLIRKMEEAFIGFEY